MSEYLKTREELISLMGNGMSKQSLMKSTKPRILRPCMMLQHSQSSKVTSPHKTLQNKIKINKNSWSELLSKNTPKIVKSGDFSQRSQYIDNEINFMQFDPINSIQFLTSELKSIINKLIPDDKNAHKILSEIQQSTIRLSNLSAQSTKNFQDQYKQNQTSQTEKIEKILFENSSQTDYILMSSKQYVTENSINTPDIYHSLNKSNELKIAYDNMKLEMDLLAKELKISKMEVVFLKKEIRFLEEKLKNNSSGSTQNKNTAIADDSSLNFIKNSFKIDELESDRLEYDKNLIYTKLENEKLMILLKSREKQIKDLLNEFSSVQNLVQEQLKTIKSDVIHDMPLSSLNSSITDVSNEHQYHKKQNPNNNNNNRKSLFSYQKSSSVFNHFPEKDYDINIINNNIQKDDDDLQFDEIRKMIGDVTIPDGPRNFQPFSNSEKSLDSSQMTTSI